MIRARTHVRWDKNWRQFSAIPNNSRGVERPDAFQMRGSTRINNIKVGKEKESDIWLVYWSKSAIKVYRGSIVLRGTISYGAFRGGGERGFRDYGPPQDPLQGDHRSAIRYIKGVYNCRIPDPSAIWPLYPETNRPSFDSLLCPISREKIMRRIVLRKHHWDNSISLLFVKILNCSLLFILTNVNLFIIYNKYSNYCLF